MQERVRYGAPVCIDNVPAGSRPGHACLLPLAGLEMAIRKPDIG